MDAKEAGQIMQGHRKKRKLTQDQVVEQSTVPTPQYLSALENGRYDIRNSEHFESLANLYGLTAEQVREINPSALIHLNAPDSPRFARGSPIKPLTDIRDEDVHEVLPPELQEFIDKNAKDYPELLTDKVQRGLMAFRREVGDGPQSVDDWRSYFFAHLPYIKGKG